MITNITPPRAGKSSNEGVIPANIAMLRGVNVGGNAIKMERLRAAFEDLGFSAVRTYVQSGNVILEAAQGSPAALSRKIEERILRECDLSVPVILKTSKAMEHVVRANPFVKDKTIDQSKLHVALLSDTPPKTAVEVLEPLAAKSERFRVLNQEIYLYCPDGYGRTKLSNNAIERKLSVVATTRNWRTVNTLLEMAQS
jgi:uncharacterized protein (DUF1697 family)